MNILTDTLPESIMVDGREIPIYASFRGALKTMTAFEDEELTAQERVQIVLSNLYPDIPQNTEAALELANWFLNGGGSASEESGRDNDMRLYSFVKDANLIYAAFRQTHGIDLQTAELHWWVFLALFMDLGADTTFCNLISLRKRVKTGKATKEEKQAAQEMGDAFDVPDIDKRTLLQKERERDFLELVS